MFCISQHVLYSLSSDIPELNVPGSEYVVDKKFDINITKFDARRRCPQACGSSKFCAWGGCRQHPCQLLMLAGRFFDAPTLGR
jgi:hypothetical protein